jgi:4-hydroxythreonine-4-phosphate dehydrogenase
MRPETVGLYTCSRAWEPKLASPPNTGASDLPTVALAMGDPAGISAELTAKLLALPEARGAARVVVIGDLRVLHAGARVANVDVRVDVVSSTAAALAARANPVFVDLGHWDPADVALGKVSKAGGAFALRNFRTALEFARDGHAHAVCYAPLNKAAMRQAHPSYDDEIGFLHEVLDSEAHASEFNILGNLWNARVTSHVALKEVAVLITQDAIVKSVELVHAALIEAGVEVPRIAVAALNPHAGDGGNFGREEIDVIAPAIATANSEGIAASGPFPADTVFLRARDGAFHAVLTMYHDQGQIAMKLMGFDRGVTLLGGFPFPVTTPAHGTAYDIVGTGSANVGATREAFLLAARMGARRKTKTA